MNPDSFPAASTNNDLYVVSRARRRRPPRSRRRTAGTTTIPATRPTAASSRTARCRRPGFEADRIAAHALRPEDRRDLESHGEFRLRDRPFLVERRFEDALSSRSRTGDAARSATVSIKGGDAALVIRGGYDTDLAATPDGKYLVFARQSATRPVDLYRATVKGKDVTALTDDQRDASSPASR